MNDDSQPRPPIIPQEPPLDTSATPPPSYGVTPPLGYGATPPPSYGVTPPLGYGATPPPGYGVTPPPGYSATPPPNPATAGYSYPGVVLPMNAPPVGSAPATTAGQPYGGPAATPPYGAPAPAYAMPTAPAYAMPPVYYVAPPEKAWPVPRGRVATIAWGVALIALTVLAIAASLLGSLTAPTVAFPSGAPAYSSTLTTDDGAWRLLNNSGGACAFTDGALVARETDGGIQDLCALRSQSFGDVFVSARVLPDNVTTDGAVIIVRASVAVVFLQNGAWLILDPIGGATLAHGVSLEWHTQGASANDVLVIVRGAAFTIAINGVRAYQGDLSGTGAVPANGSVGLTAVSNATGPGVAAFANFQVGTP